VRHEASRLYLSFKIHRLLLEESAPDLQIEEDAYRDLFAEVDTTKDVMQLFTHWLYTGEIAGTLPGFNFMAHTFVDTYGLGKEVGCIVFADMVIDGLVERVDDYEDSNDLAKLIEVSVNLGRHSPQRNFFLDILVYKHRIACGSDLARVFEALLSTSVDSLGVELAHRIYVVKAIQPPPNRDIEAERLLICGLFAMRTYNANEFHKYPWIADRCRYHRHTSLGYQCHASKE
jgi:hypothetical protein